MNDTILNITGNLTADPEIRYTPQGAAVVSFTVASTPRAYNKQTNEWEDGDTLYMRCSAWRQLAENVAESLTKGSRVMVEGKLKQRSYETKEGEKRTVIEVEATEVAASLRNATCKVARVERTAPAPRATTAPAADPFESTPEEIPF